jgi:S-adenosylmethionine hydrolase
LVRRRDGWRPASISRRSVRPSIEALGGGQLVITIGPRQLSGLVATYADVPPGEICALVGSSNHLEIAANGSSAAAILGLDRGAPVLISAAP